MQTIQAAYSLPENRIETTSCAILSNEGVRWVMDQLGRGHEAETVLEGARRLHCGTLYGAASMNRYSLEKHLGGFWD